MTAAVQDQGSVERLLGTVGEAMTRAVILLAADMPAEWALRRLEHHAVSGAPVVDHGRVVGVVTRRDLLIPVQARGPQANPLAGLRVRDLMSEEPVTARPDLPLVSAAGSMIDQGVNRLPVVDQEGRALGILTRDNVLRAVAGRPGEGDGGGARR